MKIIDITRPVFNGVTVWPGDEGVDIINYQKMSEGAGNNNSKISIGAHTATHMDAPKHFVDAGKEIHELNLNRFIGKCRVIEVYEDKYVTKQSLIDNDIKKNDIILIKTKNSYVTLNEPFIKDFIALDDEAAQYVVDIGIKCVGLDYLSIAPNGFLGKVVHEILLKNETGVLEGLCLKDVHEGEYFLSSLPLKLIGIEGSPMRAVLIPLEDITHNLS